MIAAGEVLRRRSRGAFVLGAGGVAAGVLLAVLLGEPFWLPWLFAVHLCFGLGLGAAGILMTHHLTDGRWGHCLLRPLQAMTATVPLLALLFVPVLFAVGRLYPWTSGLEAPVVQRKAAYLDVPFFVARTVGCLVVWSLLALALSRAAAMSRPALASVGLLVLVVTIGFAAVDQVGSLEPRWYSSIFGLEVGLGHAVTAMAVLAALACAAARSQPPAAADDVASLLNDLGNLLLTFVALDAYFAFVQYLIVWNGNLPGHVVWFVPRMRGAWGLLGWAALVLQFALPLVALLFRAVKRAPRRLFGVAVVVLCGRVVGAAWTVLPASGRPASLQLVPALACAVGVAGLWTAAFLGACRRRLEAAT